MLVQGIKMKGPQEKCGKIVLVRLQGELDELEREEFFRLKKVQDKKERDLEKKKAEKEAQAKHKAAAAGTSAPIGAYSPPPPANTSALPADDADLIF